MFAAFPAAKHLLVTSGVIYVKCIAPQYGPVAQLDRALACGAKGRKFESCRVHHRKKTSNIARLFSMVKDDDADLDANAFDWHIESVGWIDPWFIRICRYS